MAEPNEEQKQLLKQRRIASVATIGADGMPHLTSVWFVYENGALYLAIPFSSAKGKNLSANANVAVMVDVRKSYKEAGLTAIGEAELVFGDQAASIVRRVHEKYLSLEALDDPQVGPVFAAVDDLAVRLVPRKWLSWDMGQLDQQVFGGAIARNGYLKALEP